MAGMLFAQETPATLEPEDAAYMAAHLCRPGSEMRDELQAAATETPMAVAYQHQPIAWVASHVWQGMQTIEAFTAQEWRRRGLCRIGVLTLLAAGYLDKDRPVAVFSLECYRLAESLGFRAPRLYRRHAGGWQRVSV